MNYNNELLAQEWSRVSDLLGLDVRLHATINLLKAGNNQTICVPVLLKNFGNKNGMIIISDYNDIEDIQDILFHLGYGFTVLQPSNLDNIEANIESYKEMLMDWVVTEEIKTY